MSRASLVLRPALRWPILVFALSLSLRLLYLQGHLPLLERRQTPIFGDAVGYYFSASLLAKGKVSLRGLLSSTAGDPRGAERQAIGVVDTRGPGYVLFLAGAFRLFGVKPWPVRYVQALLGALACVLVYAIGRELSGRRAALLAGLFAAVYPSSILFTGRILTETLATFLFSVALLWLVRGLRLGSLRRVAAAGISLAAAALTRPTLLATIPFLAVAAAVGYRGRGPGRTLTLLLFLVSTCVPIAFWSGYARTAGADPVAGDTGLRVVAAVARTATLPQYRGWRTDDIGLGDLLLGSRPGVWREIVRTNPTYPIAAAANLVFCHLWFLDNLWREIPPWLHGLQRALALLAFGGLVIALARWRRFAPLLFSLAAFAVVSVKWIEIRPNLPFMAVLFVLAGALLARVIRWAREAPRSCRRVSLLALAIAATVLLLVVSRVSVLVTLLPFVHAVTLGRGADMLAVLLILGWAIAIRRIVREGGTRGRRSVPVFLAVSLLVLLFMSYAWIGSTPRWRSWQVDVHTLPRPLSQEIRLPEPIPPGRIAHALWLVDLESGSDPPPLRVALQGSWLGSAQHAWRRLFCDPHNRFPENRKDPDLCPVYVTWLSGFTRAFASSPQWWGIEVNPRLVEGANVLSLTLAPTEPEAGRAEGGGLRVGGTWSAEPANVFSGPSVQALTTGFATSLYRWHVTNDWRMWTSTSLASRRTVSRMDGASDDDPPDADQRIQGLARRLAREEGHWNIRLLVTDVEGKRSVF